MTDYIDKVDASTARSVAYRDGFRCVAPAVDGRAGYCRDKWGQPILHWANAYDRNRLTIAHIKGEGEQQMGKRASSDREHLVLLCWGHHEGNGVTGEGGSIWATKRENLEHLRRYLEQFSDHHPRTHVPVYR